MLGGDPPVVPLRCSAFWCPTCKTAMALEDGGEAYKAADCQAADGSVLVSWQGCEGEGHPEADEGVYLTLGHALEKHPDAVPVCPGCDPQLGDDGEVRHGESCGRDELGSVRTFFSKEKVTRDGLYERLVCEAGLYGQAFFGWTPTPTEQRTLDGLWEKAQAAFEQKG